jgi:hypothetical protein
VNVITISGTDGTNTGTYVLTVTYNVPDTTPDQFTFTDITNAALSTVYISNTITVSGISASAAVTVSGGTYSKNGLAYTANNGTAVLGDTFSVRQTSSSGYSIATSAILSIGGVTDAYTVTTTSGNIVTSPVPLNGLIMGNGVVMR